MPTSLILNPDLLQEAIDLNTDIPIETLVETALRAYIDQYKHLKTILRTFLGGYNAVIP